MKQYRSMPWDGDNDLLPDGCSLHDSDLLGLVRDVDGLCVRVATVRDVDGVPDAVMVGDPSKSRSSSGAPITSLTLLDSARALDMASKEASGISNAQAAPTLFYHQ